ncbi:MAG: hypothetical protein WCD18_19265 [Thermosynechococcaceae cyanobacterium]
MSNVRKLLEQLSTQAEQLRSAQFLAPCVRRGRVRTRLAGMVYTFIPQPSHFEGWGIFQPSNEQIAVLATEANLPQIETYLNALQPFRLRLVRQLQAKTWLAYPVNEADVRQRIGKVHPIPVHLVTEGSVFDPAIARFDGQSWWFEALDRRADPIIADTLRSALRQLTPPTELNFKGITPEMRSTYDLVAQSTDGLSQHRQDERRLQKALKTGGGSLQSFQEQEDFWTVEWTTSDGERHTSAIAKTDLTVVSSGICLSGRDRDFDLQSLVGVIEDRAY